MLVRIPFWCILSLANQVIVDEIYVSLNLILSQKWLCNRVQVIDRPANVPDVRTYYITALQHVFGVVQGMMLQMSSLTHNPLRPRFVEDAANSK
jgi:hypothetical protein